MAIESLILSIAMAIAAGLVGSFAVMRRMTLAADALSHVALPGIGIALALHIHPILGAAATLFFGAFLVWVLDERSHIATETIVGVVFSTALAIGSLMASPEELIDALFGGAGALSWTESLIGLFAAAAIVAFVLTQKNRLAVALVSKDVARTAGVDVSRLNLLFLFSFALTIALGLRYLGVLLMGALVIIPAATAKRLARTLDGMLRVAVLAAVAATIAGASLAAWLHRETGPLIVTMAAVGYFASLLKRQG